MKKLVASIVALAAASAAQALPVQWTVGSGGNGHYYDFVGGSFTWNAALAAAGSSSYAGNQGYLATVTSSGETSFLVNSVNGNTLGWIAGQYDDGWKWATGPEAGQAFAYTSWNGGEPNGNAGEPAVVNNWGSSGNWNDWSPANQVGYFVEYGGLGTNVPEPAQWALMLGGFGLLGMGARRRRSATVYA